MEKVILIKKEATPQEQAGPEQDLTLGTQREPQFGTNPTQRRSLLFSPERQAITGVIREFESKLMR